MDRLVSFAVERRVLMVGLFAAVVIGGLIAFRALNIEAYPDPTPPMVDVVTQSPGLSAEEIERYITIPLEAQVAGLKNLNVIRTISLYGLSDVKLQFSFDFTYEQALQQVLNRLAQMAPLPNGALPQISPLSPIGEIYRYRLVGPPNYSVLDLKTLQDWILQRRFRTVPGVIDVTGWGGKTKTYELQVDFNKLVANGLTLPQLLQAISNSNINVGGNTVNIGPQAAVVRGVGLIRSIDALASTMIAAQNGTPVLVKDVAEVTVGSQPRLGIAGENNDDDIVQGIVLMRRGEQSSPTIARVEELVERINHSSILPPGVRIERIYDRKDLIDTTTKTVLENMVFGIVLIVLLQWIFLGDLRSALIVGATIPFALFFAVSILVLRGESANLLVGRRDRFRPDRRCHRDHGGGDLPPAGAYRAFFGCGARGGLGQHRHGHEASCDPDGGGRRVAFDLLCGGDHHRGLPAAVHAERRRRQHLLADGAHLCLRAGRRPACDLHGDAGAERDHPARPCRGDRDADHALAEPHLPAGAALVACEPPCGAGRRRRADRDDGRRRSHARAGIPAEARGGQPLDPRDVAADDLAAGGQLLCQRDAQADRGIAGSGVGGVAARPSR